MWADASPEIASMLNTKKTVSAFEEPYQSVLLTYRLDITTQPSVLTHSISPEKLGPENTPMLTFLFQM